jgi:hypothetical protein
MRVKQVLDRVDESWLGLLLGAAIGNMAHQKKINGGLALMVTAATYAGITKLAPEHRKTLVVTAANQSEALAQGKLVRTLLDKMSYKLDDMEYIGATGRKWTLSAK